MKWFFSKNDLPVAIVISSSTVHCALFTHQKNGLTLVAYKAYSLMYGADHQSSFLDTLCVEKAMRSFINEYVGNRPVVIGCALDVPYVQDHVIQNAQATPSSSFFSFERPVHLVWDYRYLFPVDDGIHCFYISAINQPTLLMLKLIAIKNRWDIGLLTSKTSSYLYYYFASMGQRSAMLRDSMMRYQYNIEALVGEWRPPVVNIKNKESVSMGNHDTIALAGVFLGIEGV